MRILFLSRWFPYPSNNGSKLRIFNLLRGLSQFHRVTLISFIDPGEGVPNREGLSAICDQVKTVIWREYRPSSLRSLLALANPNPRSVVDTYSNEMADTIRKTLQDGSFDLIIASQVDMAAYAPVFGVVPALLEEVETGVIYQEFQKASSGFARLRYSLTWLKQRNYLRQLLPRFRVCTAVSQQEVDLIRATVPGYQNIKVISNGVDLESACQAWGEPEPNSLIYTGSFRYFANHDAMLWFASEIFPLIRVQIPTARLTITGDTGGKDFPLIEGVNLAGQVPDVRPLVTASWVSLAPLRIGGGTRLKILEAFSLRTPVVATSKGAEGLAVRGGEHLLIGDTPAAFANHVIGLLRDWDLREKLARQAYKLVEQEYSWSVILPRFLTLVEQSVLRVR